MTTLGRWWPRLKRAHTRIAARLLLFNLLLVFLPVAGLIYLDAYEENLLDQQERAMADAGRVLAAALTDRPVTAEAVAPVMTTLGQRTDARFRLVSLDRTVVADSHTEDGSISLASAAAPSATRGQSEARGSRLYQFGAALGRALRRLTREEHRMPVAEPIATASGRLAGVELDAALAGRYGSTTRFSPGGQRSVTLYSALPIVQDGRVAGVVLVSQSTWRILQRVYDVRLRIFTVVMLSMGLAILLMVVASMTIVTPVRRLRDDAAGLADRRGRLLRRFRGTERHDEIGELARALDDLTARLEAQLRFTEGFSADVSHEFRNPLASIRATAELAADATDSGERAAFVARIQRDIRRLEGLLEGVREMTLVDAQLEEDPRTAIDIVALVREAVGERGCGIQVRLPPQSVRVEASADRLRQVLGNLVDNAISFSPADAPPAVSVTATPSDVTVSIRDHGPGLANAHAARVFDRFFSHRPGQPDARTRHAGLGLSIAKAIVESYDGRIEIRNHDDGGAVASFTLPRC